MRWRCLCHGICDYAYVLVFVRVKLVETVSRLSVAAMLELVTCKLRNLLACLRASMDSRDKAIK